MKVFFGQTMFGLIGNLSPTVLEILSIIFFYRKSEPPQTLKLLPSSADDTNRKSIRGVSSSRILQNIYTYINASIFGNKELIAYKPSNQKRWQVLLELFAEREANW